MVRNMPVISVTLDPGTLDLLDQLGAEHGLNRSAMIRVALREHRMQADHYNSRLNEALAQMQPRQQAEKGEK